MKEQQRVEVVNRTRTDLVRIADAAGWREVLDIIPQSSSIPMEEFIDKLQKTAVRHKLNFGGEANQLAAMLGRDDGDIRSVSRRDVLLLKKRLNPPPQFDYTPSSRMSDRDLGPDRPEWDEKSVDGSVYNTGMPVQSRKYFSTPERMKGGLRSSASGPSLGSWICSEAQRERPAWNDKVEVNANEQVPAALRTYFYETEKPVRDKIQQKLSKSRAGG